MVRSFVCENCGESNDAPGTRGRVPKKCFKCRKIIAEQKRKLKSLVVKTTEVISGCTTSE